MAQPRWPKPHANGELGKPILQQAPEAPQPALHAPWVAEQSAQQLLPGFASCAWLRLQSSEKASKRRMGDGVTGACFAFSEAFAQLEPPPRVW